MKLHDSCMKPAPEFLSQAGLAARLGINRITLRRDRARDPLWPVPDAFVDQARRPLYSVASVEAWEADRKAVGS